MHDTCQFKIYIDADACPVKDETYKVASRYGWAVEVVSNSFMRIPQDPLVKRVVVEQGPDVADDYIADACDEFSVVITADILLADRCVKMGATALAPNGKLFDENTIGSAVATRNLMSDLRSFGDITGGPPPFSPKDRSRFLSALDTAIVKLKKQHV